MEKETLLKLKEDILPLFLILDNWNLCYVINNQILLNKRGGWYAHYPFRAFSLLKQLYDSPITNNILPKRFSHYFKPNYEQPNKELLRYLIGEVDGGYVDVVDLELSISESFPSNIQLENIFYQYGFEDKVFFDSFSITTQEAFLIFSNILSNERCYFYAQDIAQHYLSIEDVEIDINTNFIHPYHYELFGDDYKRIVSFGLDYLLYLKDELLADSIKPFEIVFYNGIITLCYLSHLRPVREFTFQLLEEIQSPYNIPRNKLLVSFCYLNALKGAFTLGNELDLANDKSLRQLEKFVYEKNPGKFSF